MPPRRIYSDEERASAFVIYTANGGNAKRTARDANIPLSTLRDWVQEWEENGPPDLSMVAEMAGEFVADAERVRGKALAELERKIPSATPSALVATVGMLTDKINLTKGLATSRTETQLSLPPAEDIAAALGAAIQGAISAARERELEIIDAEVLELPAPAKTEQATSTPFNRKDNSP